MGRHKPDGGKVKQDDLAKLLGCGRRTIAGYLSGTTLPPLTRLPHYAEVLSVPVERLAAIVAADRTARDNGGPRPPCRRGGLARRSA